MALLIGVAVITLYAIVLTVFHMKHLDEIETMEHCVQTNLNTIEALKFKIKHIEFHLKRAVENAEADFQFMKKKEEELRTKLNEVNIENGRLFRENERLLNVNNRLMERVKRLT